jgi:hypothetical protein
VAVPEEIFLDINSIGEFLHAQEKYFVLMKYEDSGLLRETGIFSLSSTIIHLEIFS